MLSGSTGAGAEDAEVAAPAALGADSAVEGPEDAEGSGFRGCNDGKAAAVAAGAAAAPSATDGCCSNGVTRVRAVRGASCGRAEIGRTGADMLFVIEGCCCGSGDSSSFKNERAKSRSGPHGGTEQRRGGAHRRARLHTSNALVCPSRRTMSPALHCRKGVRCRCWRLPTAARSRSSAVPRRAALVSAHERKGDTWTGRVKLTPVLCIVLCYRLARCAAGCSTSLKRQRSGHATRQQRRRTPQHGGHTSSECNDDDE